MPQTCGRQSVGTQAYSARSLLEESTLGRALW
jgi:hypothetical protein